MAKMPDKIEDWTPPWKDGEFDEDAAKGLIFNLSKNLERSKAQVKTLREENSELESKNSDIEARLATKPGDESAKDAQITELTKKVKTLEKGSPEHLALIEKYEVALEVGGLSLRDAKRLVGDSRDELVEDAEDLASRLSGGGKDGKDDGENPPAPPVGQRPAPRANGRGEGNEPPKLLSPDDIVAAAAKAGGAPNNGLHITTR